MADIEARVREMERLCEPLEGLLVSREHFYDFVAPYLGLEVGASSKKLNFLGDDVRVPATTMVEIIVAHRPLTQADVDAILARIKSEVN